jgi:hypothetical protein
LKIIETTSSFVPENSNEESIKLHGNSVSVQQVQKYHINIMAPLSRQDHHINWLSLREK